MHSELCALSKRNAAVASHPRASERSLEILPGNSESCWKEYAQHHNSTDLDRLLMEEQVKVRYVHSYPWRNIRANFDHSVRVHYGWSLTNILGR